MQFAHLPGWLHDGAKLGNMDPLLWIEAVASQAFQFYSGIALAVFGILDWALGKDWKVFGRPIKGAAVPAMIFGACLFVWANYAAWSSEHASRLRLEANAPDFTGSITAIAGPLPRPSNWPPGFQFPQQLLLLDITIQNSGGPSIVANWSATAQGIYGQTVQGLLIPSPNSPMSWNGRDEKTGMPETGTFSIATAILRKNPDKAIGTFDGREGMLLVGFGQQIDRASVRVVFQDRTNKQYTISYPSPTPLPTASPST